MGGGDDGAAAAAVCGGGGSAAVFGGGGGGFGLNDGVVVVVGTGTELNTDCLRLLLWIFRCFVVCLSVSA